MPFTTGDGGLLQLNQEGFDFNVQFEQLFFSIIPSALFIVTSLWRTASQARKPTVVNAPVFQLIKVVRSVKPPHTTLNMLTDGFRAPSLPMPGLSCLCSYWWQSDPFTSPAYS